MLRAVQLWAPFPDNDPDGARACICELYELVGLRCGVPADSAQATALEVDWWRAGRIEGLLTAPHPGTLLAPLTAIDSSSVGGR